MFRWRIACIWVLLVLVWLCAARPASAASAPAPSASAYYGKVTFNGLPVPGATITVTQGAKKFTTVTDAGGVYHFVN